MNGDSGRHSSNGGSKAGSRMSYQGSRVSRKSGAASNLERVPQDEDEEESGSQQSVYSDEDDESSYESDLETSKESTHQTFNIAKKESNRVRVWRTVLSGMLIATAATVVVTTYLFLADNEQNEFRSTFTQAGLTVSESLRFNYVKMLDSLQSRSEEITSLVMVSGLRWPFVTIPHFEVRGARAREETLSETFGFVPLVDAEDKQKWEEYSVENQFWLLQAHGIDVEGEDSFLLPEGQAVIPTSILYVDNETDALAPYPDTVPPNNTDTPFAVHWQVSPVPFQTTTINLNLRSSVTFRPLIQALLDTQDSVLSDFIELEAYYEALIKDDAHQKMHEDYVGTNDGKYFAARDRPHSVTLTPVFDTFINGTKKVVAILYTVLPWDWQLANLLPEGTKVVHVVLDNSCGSTFTYEVTGPRALYMGPGDLHEPEFNSNGISGSFTAQPIVKAYDPLALLGATARVGGTNYTLCEYKVHVYPTAAMRAQFDTGRPETFAIIMASIFLVVGMVFLIFVRYVQQRQDMVMATAIRTSAIVSSLFPANVRERIMKDAEEQGRRDLLGKGRGGNWRLKGGKDGLGPKSKLEDFIGVEAGAAAGGDMSGIIGEGGHDAFKSKPIADLFPDATVLFADLVGFTAWSSEREPTQVFQLLETLYHAYDTIARKRRVFKVETIGDCYVAVTGLPEPRKDHAVAMARFARDCMQKMKVLVVKLEVPLGPGTADLSMRFGLHSGPVTAGVLRGEKSRFQLFGDTVNTAARMESNGAREKIHVSQETADLIEAAGKSHWLTAREEKIQAKGKGELQTYWLEIRKDHNSSGNLGSDNESESSDYSDFTEEASSVDEDADGEIVLDERSQRLVDWTVDQLSRLLKQILARRKLLGIEANPDIAKKQVLDFSNGGTVIDEVKDIVQLCPFDPRAANLDAVVDTITLSPEVVSQLRDFVATIATLHNDNQFHNLSHATHVTMSVVKLLSRIISADDPRKQYGSGGGDASDESDDAIDVRLHEQSYGIRSDPLAQFAVVFSALIHDVDHPGVTNAELIKEGAKVAETYNNKSISEQNSVDLAWYLFMDERYCDLRGCIYHDEDELLRFRQFIVNAVIATDIADKNLKILRDARWANAFSEGSSEGDQEVINRKATVMIDCLLQASDIAHTMQHWHIYRKWNEFLFRELYVAFLQGRCAKNPVEFWYDGEIGFFDFYIIPLAKKLADCGVFGVSSDEYLNYARKNRNEWESRGKAIVQEYIENAKDLEVPDDEQSSLSEEYEDETGE